MLGGRFDELESEGMGVSGKGIACQRSDCNSNIQRRYPLEIQNP